MKKTEKARIINEALAKSEWAQEKQAEAFITEDGRLEYRMLAKSSCGHDYFVKATYREVIFLLHGSEMRRLNALFSKRRGRV